MSSPCVCVSILHWFSRERTENCLESVFDSEYDNLHVVLVNNGPPSEGEHFQKLFDNLTVVDTPGNIGFAPGHNRGLSEASENGDEFILFLNNDAVVEGDSIGNLVKTATDHGKRALFSPYVYTVDEAGEEKVEFTAGYFDWVRGEPYSYGSELSSDAKPLPETLAQEDIDYLHGAALFGRTSELVSLDGFDEKFFIYYEDSDLSQRAKKQGYSLVPVPDSTVRHLDYDDLSLDIFADFRAYLILRNKVWFMVRHAPRRTLPLFFAWYLFYRYPRHLYYAVAMGGGVRHALFATFGVIAGLTGTKIFEGRVRDTTNEKVYDAAFN